MEQTVSRHDLNGRSRGTVSHDERHQRCVLPEVVDGDAVPDLLDPDRLENIERPKRGCGVCQTT